MSALSERLAPLTVLDLDGQPVEMATLWGEGPTLLVYIRHYG